MSVIAHFHLLLLTLINGVEHFQFIINKIQLIVWYLNSYFFHMGTRLTGLRKLSESSTNISYNQYSPLSIPLVLELLVRTFTNIHSFCFSSISSISILNSPIKKKELHLKILNCKICLLPCNYPTVTLCGHIFCWYCICEALGKKNKCPICRQKMLIQELLILQQYI